MRARKLGRTGHGFTHGNPSATGPRGMIESGMFQQQMSRAKADTAVRRPPAPAASGLGSCDTSLVLKLLRNPNADDRTPQLRISSFSSSNHKISGIFSVVLVSSAVAVTGLRHAERPTFLLRFQSNNYIVNHIRYHISQISMKMEKLLSNRKSLQPHDDAFRRVEDSAVVNGESVSRLRGSNRVTQRRRPSTRNARQIWQATESPAGAHEREQQPLSTLAVLTRVERVELRQRDDTIVSPGLYGCRSWLGLAHCTGVAIHISIDSCALL
ncbi:hypothetical protein ALC53_11220 [Atta colombica]|uniref:Uncharacterized protein n=1 Tax=Atta colombica TaxID=520822 RepID=A0A195B2Q3_9HYME|nr:hypothetical protein ALC53_11220 [Atta colombica]